MKKRRLYVVFPRQKHETGQKIKVSGFREKENLFPMMSIDNICPACAATLMHILAYCGLGLPVAGHPGHRDQWGWAQSKQLIPSITCVLHLACQRFPIRRVSHGEKRVGPENVQVKNRWACTVWVAALLAPGVVWVSPPPADHFFFFFFARLSSFLPRSRSFGSLRSLEGVSS